MTILLYWKEDIVLYETVVVFTIAHLENINTFSSDANEYDVSITEELNYEIDLFNLLM